MSRLFERSGYSEAAFEAIVHLQHFAELKVKEALRASHPALLVLDRSHHNELFDILQGKADLDATRLQTIEAGVALQRVLELIRSGRISDEHWGFIAKHREFLQKLNELRNRLWHRGTMVLGYNALDAFFGCHALPFIRSATEHDSWGCGEIAVGVDPLKLIEGEMRQDNPSIARVAMLKELARAAYRHPLNAAIFNINRRSYVEAVVRAFGGPESARTLDVRRCPVCGLEALVRYTTISSDPIIDLMRHEVDMVSCEGCGLELFESYGEPDDLGLGVGRLWERDDQIPRDSSVGHEGTWGIFAGKAATILEPDEEAMSDDDGA
jgi:hypothetical protein